MNTPARTEILARIRRAKHKALLPDVTGLTPPPPEPPPFDRPLVDVFTEALRAVQGACHIITQVEEAAELLTAACRSQGQDALLAWDDLPLPELPQALAARGIRVIPSRLTGADRKAELRALSQWQVGVTGAAAGLARTGSIVLHGDQTHGRSASLMPDIHFAILPEDRLFPDLAAWIGQDATAQAIMRSSNTVIITGPSRTADIAQTLTLGAHGPRELHVLLFRK